MPTLLAPALKAGDTIGFFSPSAPATVFAPTRFARAKDYLHAKGFKLVAGNLTGQQDFYRSGSIEQRADELNNLIRNPDVRCIMSTIGGMNSNSMLPYLDYDALRADPKIIIGYSDVTALLLGIYAKTGLITYYGPALVASFGEFPPLVDRTFEYFSGLLQPQQKESYHYQLPEQWTDIRLDWATQDHAKETYANNCQFLGKGKISGRVIGGNLNTLSGIWGSPYMPAIQQDDILLLEDSLHDIATVERSFSMLKLNGIFDKVSAVLLGKHELFDHKGTQRSPLDVLQEVLAGQPLAIVNNFDCSHTHPMMTVPLGAQLTVDFDQQQVTVNGPWVG